jgi:phosphoribosyl 1,2-cyclic phosphodiesterase
VCSLVSEVKPKITIITHFGMKMLREDPLIMAREIHKKTKQSVIAAKDGMTLNPISFSTRIKQETLNKF